MPEHEYEKKMEIILRTFLLLYKFLKVKKASLKKG